MDLLSLDEEDGYETETVTAFLEETKCVEELVVNFNGSLVGHQALNRCLAHGHVTLYEDYFAPDALF